MPMIWEKPEVAAEVDGKRIYHTYYDDDTVSSNWYTTDPSQDDADGAYDAPDYRFDITDIALPRTLYTTQARLEYIIRNKLVPFPED